jgi:hypothetical protein
MCRSEGKCLNRRQHKLNFPSGVKLSKAGKKNGIS